MKITISRIVSSLFFVLIGIGISFSSSIFAATEQSENRYQTIALMGEVLEVIKENYVRDIDESILLNAAIDSMVGVLDQHSKYYSPAEYKKLREKTRGEFGGIGIRVSRDDERKGILVVSVIENSPSSEAGLQDNDLIVAIEGNSTRSMTLAEGVKRMRGEVGAPLTITILRDNMPRFDVTLKRAIIKLDPVSARVVDDDIVYLHLGEFNDHASDSLKKAFDDTSVEIVNSGNQVSAVILDLRNNPGGLLSEAVNVTDLFLNQGEIVSTRGREDGNSRRFNARKGTLHKNLELIVLINQNSASASEIVAGALQDHEQALLIGKTSYGKGSVQSTFSLGDDQVHGALKLTIQNYYTPSGRSIDSTGITPDVVIELPEHEEGSDAEFVDTQLNEAIRQIKE